MTDTRSRLPWIVWGVELVLFVPAMWLSVLNNSFANDAIFIVIAILLIAGYTTVGAVVASRSPGNVIGWIMIAIGVGFFLSASTNEYAIYAYATDPGALPLREVAAWLSNWIFLPSIICIIPLLLLFPTGTVPSPRWRRLPALIAALAVLGIVGTILQPGRLDIEGASLSNPTGVPALRGAVQVAQTIAGWGLIAAALASLVALALRFRRAEGEERQQIRWLAYVSAVGGIAFLVALISSIGIGPNDKPRLVNDIAFWAFFVCLSLGVPSAAGVAILKYRLWDLDLVVKKTVVAAILVVLLTAIGVVVGVVVGGVFVGPASDSSLAVLLGGVAMGLLAWPLLRLARRIADHVVYGGRATPYEVMTEFSERLSETYSTEDVLPHMAQILAGGTGAETATVWLRVGGELRPAASWPSGAARTEPIPTDPDRLPTFPAGESAVEVRDQGELLGAVSVTMPASDPMNPTKEKLVSDMASQAGLVLRNVRLIEELRASRQRLVAAQDVERRRIERNIHDGAQQRLVALSVKLRLARGLSAKDPAKADEMLSEIETETTETLEDLRDLARGIYPPLLADKGLPAALEAQARRSVVPVELEANDVGRLAPEVEAAVYFCTLEALQNVAKYADATHVSVRLEKADGRLAFEVRDDGRGFDPAAKTLGMGLQGMADRLDAIGGVFSVTSSPGAGTSVVGHVPAAVAND